MSGTVTLVEPLPDGTFITHADNKKYFSRTVLLATGTTDVPIAFADHDYALSRGILRYCPICDGYEAIDKKIGVMGNGSHGVDEAIFISRFSSNASLLSPKNSSDFSLNDLNRLDNAGIRYINDKVQSLNCELRDSISACVGPKEILNFDILYSAMGLRANSDLATCLGVASDKDGQLVVDAHMHTTVQGLFACGDNVEGLNQISVATGQSAVAATAIHNFLK